MNAANRYENFPSRLVLVCSSVQLAIYALGSLILSGLGVGAVALYLAICLALEVHVMRRSCVNCFYYGKWCGFGKGKLAARLFGRGETRRFTDRTVTWRTILPDMLVFLLPLLGGIVLLFQDFSVLLVVALAGLIALATVGTATVRGSISCQYCKQKDLGCPAQQLFQAAQQK